MSIDANGGANGAGPEARPTGIARIASPRDFIAGLLFAAIGVATAVGASDYPLGTIRNIGPGYYPILIGIALVLLGGAIALKALKAGGEEAPVDGGFALRPLIMVIAAVVAFGFLVRPFGLAAAIVALIVLSSFAGRGFSLLRVVLLSVGMVALAWFVFIYLLGLTMNMWPR
jgi:hypothetical protein